MNHSPASDDRYATLRERFVRIFGPGERIHVVRAPGRVNLIGEHTDYNDGFVLPMAIEPEVILVCRSRPDSMVKIGSTVYPNEFVEFSVDQKIERGKPAWGNYIRGVAAGLIAAGIPLSGVDGLFSNTLPVGGGLSSSAAIEVAAARGMLVPTDKGVDNDRLALICQKAEHDFAQMPCGIMDQMIVANGRAGQAMLLDCRDLSRQYIPIDSRDLRVVIANSMVHHELTGSEYAVRRRQCQEGVGILQRRFPDVKALRDVSLDQLLSAQSDFNQVVYRRCWHVISENARTTEMAKMLELKHYDEAGELMVKSHHSLRDDFEVSCVELDFLVDEAMKVRGVYGARMTGGGFGGSIVALAQPRHVDVLIGHLHQTYTARFGRQPEIFVTTAAAGGGSDRVIARGGESCGELGEVGAELHSMPIFRDILEKLCRREDLTRDEARQAFAHMMTGQAADAQIGGLLVGLAAKGTTVEELIGAASVMREHVVPIVSPSDGVVLDTCGTGGDVRQTFNISTAAALIAAGAGVKVVKHGNRSASGRAGSADVLEKLGLNLQANPDQLANCLARANICFAFARQHHPAMRFVGTARSALGIPTIFNILGPLTNPAGARHQLLGVFAPELTDRLAAVLREMGSVRAWVVHANDGLDEISTLGPTRVSELREGHIHTWMLDPADFGLPYARLSDLQVETVDDAARALVAVLENTPGTMRDIALLNAAAALLVAERADDLPSAYDLASDTLRVGKGREALDRLIETSRQSLA